MDITKSLNNAMEYVVDNLDNEIDVSKVSKIAGCSTFSFTRMFPFLAGISFNEYLRKRRLTKAGYELQNTDIKILDLYFESNLLTHSHIYVLNNAIEQNEGKKDSANGASVQMISPFPH